MTIDPNRTPVLVGLGQSIERDAVVDVVELASRAARSAFADAPGLEGRIQRLSMVATSFSRVSRSPASEVAAALGLTDLACEVTTPGGNTPQWLMNRACEEIARGKLETTLICGGEATRSMKRAEPDADFLMAARSNMEESEVVADPVVGASVRGLLAEAEVVAGLLRPADIYPLFESVLAARAGATPAAWREVLAAFLSRSSAVAAKNPMAWMQTFRTPEEIATPSPDNRLTAEPYTKCMNSFANVDQGSALLVTTLAQAKALGLVDQCVYPWAGASNADLTPGTRPDLGGSPGIRAAAAASFRAAGLGLDDIDVIDLYSCFPVAVEISAAEIGLALDDPRGLTTTGGMSFFGGPGNNYTSHGIACSALRLREGAGFAYTTGNGGLLSKHSVGIYGNAPPPKGFVRANTDSEQAEIQASAIELVSAADGDARVEAGTVVYDRSGDVAAAPIVASLPDGRRVVAKAEEGILSSLAGRSLVGETVRVSGASPPVYTI